MLLAKDRWPPSIPRPYQHKMKAAGNSFDGGPNPRLKLDEQSDEDDSEYEYKNEYEEESLPESNSNICESGTDNIDGEGDEDGGEADDDTPTEEDLQQLKVAELKELLKKFEMPVSGKKHELIQRILGRGKGTKDVKEWKKSKAKKFLLTLINDPKSKVHTMTDEEIYKSHHWFQNYPFSKFKGYLRTLQTAAEERWKVVAMYEREIRLEMIRFPRNELTSRGYPFWHTHLAKSLLEEDVREGRADEMKPKQLWLSRDEYQEFPHPVFCHHVHQEKRKQREQPGWVAKRNKKARKMHEKEMKENKEGWNSRQHKKDINELIEKFENAITLSSDEEEASDEEEESALNAITFSSDEEEE